MKDANLKTHTCPENTKEDPLQVNQASHIMIQLPEAEDKDRCLKGAQRWGRTTDRIMTM